MDGLAGLKIDTNQILCMSKKFAELSYNFLNSKIFSKWTISSPDEITESNRFGPKGIDLSPKDMSKQVLPFGPFFGPKWLLPIQGHYIKPGPTSCIAILMKLVSRL